MAYDSAQIGVFNTSHNQNVCIKIRSQLRDVPRLNSKVKYELMNLHRCEEGLIS
jgi:hypothetical protein